MIRSGQVGHRRQQAKKKQIYSILHYRQKKQVNFQYENGSQKKKQGDISEISPESSLISISVQLRMQQAGNIHLATITSMTDVNGFMVNPKKEIAIIIRLLKFLMIQMRSFLTALYAVA